MTFWRDIQYSNRIISKYNIFWSNHVHLIIAMTILFKMFFEYKDYQIVLDEMSSLKRLSFNDSLFLFNLLVAWTSLLMKAVLQAC